MYTLTTEIELPITHCLYNGAYSGLCVGNVYRDKTNDGDSDRYDLGENVLPVLHGHQYFITVNLVMDNDKLNEDGMLIDFKLFKKIINKHLGKYDHSMVLSMNNPLVKIYAQNFKDNGIDLSRSRLYIWGEKENPTAEYMARRWWLELFSEFQRHKVPLKNLKISVGETPNNICSFSLSENEAEYYSKTPSYVDQTVCGIYKISNLKTGKSYIGRSTDILYRWKYHLKESTKGNPFDLILRENFDPFDWDFSILEECSPEELNDKEIIWENLYDTIKNGYNKATCGKGKSFDGIKSVEEIKERRIKNNREACKRRRLEHPEVRRASDKKYENTPCKDPITGENVTLTALRYRMKRHPEKYEGCKTASHYKIKEQEG